MVLRPHQSNRGNRFLMLHFTPLENIKINPERVRRQINPERVNELADSIRNLGLMHPIVLRRDPSGELVLVAGETRFNAIKQIWTLGGSFNCAGQPVPEGNVPYTDFGDLSADDALELELEENIRRTDISWQERVEAVAKLHRLRERQNPIDPSTLTRRDSLYKETAKELNVDANIVRDRVTLAEHLDDPEVRHAASERTALEIVKRKIAREHAEERAKTEPVEERSSPHKVIEGDVMNVLQFMDAEIFDVLLTDPPYGNNANTLKPRIGALHQYEDDPDTFTDLFSSLLPAINHVMKSEAHAYVFCNIRMWPVLCEWFREAGWHPWPRPLIWTKNSGQAIDITKGPAFRYEAILYAIRGGKPVVQMGKTDVLRYDSVVDKLHPAEKPVELLRDLLSRSALPGDRLLDPLAGSGSVLPAANSMNVRATVIEKNPSYAAVCRERLRQL